MDLRTNSWLENLENDLKAIPKINLMQSKSNIYLFQISDVGKKKLTDKLNHQLNTLWDLCHYSASQRKAFEHISKNLHKDDTGKTYLAFCDIEVAYLKQYFTKNKEIFQLLEIYKKLCNKLKSALNSEKNIISKRLADTENSLKKLEAQYKSENGKNFYTGGHFCESHGPCVILCTQRCESPPEQQGPHTLTVPWCDSCQSVDLDQALFSKDDKSCYVSTRTPLQQDLAFLLKQATVRSLSCEEETNGEGAPLYFGDHERGHVLAHTFLVQDSLARGFHRKYTILMLMRDKIHLLNAWPMLVKHIKEIVKDLKQAAAEVNGAEQEHRSQRAVRQAQGSPGSTGRSLSQLTGKPAVFAHLHLWFSWMLSCSLAEERSAVPSKAVISKPSPELRQVFFELGEIIFTKLTFCVLTGINIVSTEFRILNTIKSVLPDYWRANTNKYCMLINSDVWCVDWNENLPTKLPTLLQSLIKAIKDKRLPDGVMEMHLISLLMHWKSIVLSLTWPPSLNLEFLQSLNIQKADLPLLLYWLSCLCEDVNKCTQVKEQLNKFLLSK
ncbi:BHD [Trypoxylus dichotomus]